MENNQESKIYEEKRKSMERLAKYASTINDVLTEYNRKSTDETMMVKTFRSSNIETTRRKTHMENVENVASKIAGRLGLNVPVVKLMAKHHDIGHTFLGHSGEWWISGIKKNLGLGCYVHNSLGARDLMYTYEIQEKIKKRIAYMYAGDENYTETELEQVADDLWIVLDGINSHNGELSESSYVPNITKTKADFEQEVLDCHVIEGYDRKIMSATFEGNLMRLCDKITYIPYDMVDGLREGMIKELDEEYIDCLVPILTADNNMTLEEAVKFIRKCEIKENYQELAGTLQDIFAKNVDLVEKQDETTGEKITEIKMDSEISKRMHKLRDINNKKVVNYVLMKEDHQVYPKAIEELVQECGNILMDEKLVKKLNGADDDIELSQEMIEIYKDSPYLGFIKYCLNTNEKDYKWTKNMIQEARKYAIDTEIEEAFDAAMENKNVNFANGQEDRVRRIRGYKASLEEQIRGMEKKGYQLGDEDYTKMKDYLKEKIAPRLYPSQEESLALEFGAKYLATLSDSEFMNLLQETGKITDKQFASLTRKYKEIDLLSEYQTHKEWDSVSQAQSMATEKGEK